jgi:hypothetical protein
MSVPLTTGSFRSRIAHYENMPGYVRPGGIPSSGSVNVDHLNRLLSELHLNFASHPGVIEADAVVTNEVDTLHLRTTTIRSATKDSHVDLENVTFQAGVIGSANQPVKTLYVDNLVFSNDFEWVLTETRPAGQAAGNFTTNQWMVRRLNHEVLVETAQPTNASAGTTILDPQTYRFTLLPGKYEISWSCPGVRCGSHRSALYNVTLGRFDGFGNNSMSLGNEMTNSSGDTSIILTVTTTFELQHFCTNTRQVDGMGVALGTPGVTEVYSTLKIKGRIADAV